MPGSPFSLSVFSSGGVGLPVPPAMGRAALSQASKHTPAVHSLIKSV